MVISHVLSNLSLKRGYKQRFSFFFLSGQLATLSVAHSYWSHRLFKHAGSLQNQSLYYTEMRYNLIFLTVRGNLANVSEDTARLLMFIQYKVKLF